MPHQLPKQQFHRNRLLTLNEAFDRVGRFKFPLDWTGLEAFALLSADRQHVRNTKASLETAFDNAASHARALRVTKISGMDRAEVAEHIEALKQAEQDRNDAREELDRYRRSYDASIVDVKAYERRAAVEHHLCEVIRRGDLEVRLGHGFSVDISDWYQRSGFQMSFAFSYIIAPETHGDRRRFPAYFIKDRFNAWARPFETDLWQFRSDRIEEQIFEWFLGFRTDCIANGAKFTREESKERCEAFFGRNDLGATFDAVWKLLSVNEMKPLGRPRAKA